MRASPSVILLLVTTGGECAGAGCIDLVEGFDEDGTNGGDAGYDEDNPHFGSGKLISTCLRHIVVCEGNLDVKGCGD